MSITSSLLFVFVCVLITINITSITAKEHQHQHDDQHHDQHQHQHHDQYQHQHQHQHREVADVDIVAGDETKTEGLWLERVKEELDGMKDDFNRIIQQVLNGPAKHQAYNRFVQVVLSRSDMHILIDSSIHLSFNSPWFDVVVCILLMEDWPTSLIHLGVDCVVLIHMLLPPITCNKFFSMNIC